MVDGRRKTDEGWTKDGRTPEDGYTISSPCEPNGSGELKLQTMFSQLELHKLKLKATEYVYISNVWSILDMLSLRMVSMLIQLNLRLSGNGRYLKC